MIGGKGMQAKQSKAEGMVNESILEQGWTWIKSKSKKNLPNLGFGRNKQQTPRSEGIAASKIMGGIENEGTLGAVELIDRSDAQSDSPILSPPTPIHRSHSGPTSRSQRRRDARWIKVNHEGREGSGGGS
jgi:hypothetical protein